MANAIATAYVQIVPTTAGLQNAISSEFNSAGNVAGTAMGGGMLVAAKKFIAPLAAIFAAVSVVDLFGNAVEQSSSLNESLNAVKVSYGDAQGAVAALGEDAARRLGISQVKFNEAAVRFSGFAKQIAGDGGNVSGVVNELTQRATDFASVFNVDVSEALQIFQSGLSGEAEPLKRYGINLLDSAVNAYALANGIGDGTGALTENEKVLARYGLLMQSTSQTQGDFANTSGGLANQQRILQSSWNDLLATIGQALLPVMTALTNFLNDYVIPAFTWLTDTVGPKVQAFFDTVVKPKIDDFNQNYGPKFAEVWQTTIQPAIDTFFGQIWPVLEKALTWLATYIVDEVMKSLEMFSDWFTDPDNKQMVQWLTLSVLGVTAALMAVPIAIAAVVAAVAWIAGAWRDYFAETENRAWSWLKGMTDVINGVIDAINNFIRAYNSILFLPDLSLVGKIVIQRPGYNYGALKAYPGMATGGQVLKGGLSWVGENGPELLNLPKGATVTPLDKASGGNTIVYHAAPNASIDAQADLFAAMRRAKLLTGAW